MCTIRRNSAGSLKCGKCDHSGEGFVNGLAALRNSLSFDLDGNFCDFGYCLEDGWVNESVFGYLVSSFCPFFLTSSLLASFLVEVNPCHCAVVEFFSW